MKTICLFIDVGFGQGGTFQYNQQVLSALLALPRSRFTLEVYYVDEAWSRIIPADVKKSKLWYPEGLKRLFKILFVLGAPPSLMRFLVSCTPLKTLSDARFDIRIFPSQDLVGLFYPHSIHVVLDLMHLYEKQFSEAASFERRKFRDRLFSSMSKYAAVILVDSTIGKHQLMESFQTDPAKIEILPYIAPAHIVEYDDRKNEAYFKNLNLPDKFIFYPAQFWAHKNHKILLEAAKVLKNRIKDFHLIFIGPQKHSFKEIYEYCKANNLSDTVSFIDFVPNEVLGGFYLRARGMVMPTYFGPTNIPPLEAIALACPVAVSNIYGMPEQLGDAALYFDNTNVTDVVNILEQLWTREDLRTALRKNSEKHFQNWNVNHFNKRVHAIIEKHSTS
jgi:glycosyltransferase involved in cell wall biosynthesis